MHFCAITNGNECCLFNWFKSLQSPKIVLTAVKKCKFFTIFRGTALDPARGLTTPPPKKTQPGFHFCRPTLFYRATYGPGTCDEEITLQSTLVTHVYFLREWHLERRRREEGMGIREVNLYGTDMPVHEHKQKNNWDKKRKLKPFHLKNIKKKERKVRQAKETVRKMSKKLEMVRPRGTVVSLCMQTRPHTSMVVLESVWFWRHGSCDVISPNHFVRGFITSLSGAVDWIFQFCKRKIKF